MVENIPGEIAGPLGLGLLVVWAWMERRRIAAALGFKKGK